VQLGNHFTLIYHYLRTFGSGRRTSKARTLLGAAAFNKIADAVEIGLDTPAMHLAAKGDGSS
jgi:hypothetical protein